MRYVGIDLAWKVSPPKERGTGFCIIDDDGKVLDLGLVTTDDEIVDLIEGDIWMGIDASLVVPQGRSMRSGERELRSRGMKVLPTSREFYMSHYGGCRGEMLARRLTDLGLEYFGSGRNALFEVYPFAVVQAVAPGPPRYKKGPRSARRAASKELLRRILEWEPSIQIPCSSMPPLVDGTGSADRMDALMAAISVYRHGLYSGARSAMVGDGDDGYILLPRGGGVDR